MACARLRVSYDLVVVGASFAGLACARAAAMRGLDVLVIDVKPEAGARVGTSGVLVKEVLDQFDLPSGLARKVRGVRLYAPNASSVDLFAPGYFFLATDTPNLLRWLADDARAAGAELRFDTLFSGAERRGELIQLRNSDVRTRYLVGADGAQSAVARAFGLGANREFLAAVEWDYEGIEKVDGRFLHCFIDQALAPGYLGWAVPGVETTQIGLAARLPSRPALAAMLGRLGSQFELSRRKVLSRRSGLIPVGGRMRPFAAPGVLLIGDAAGWVSPLTGGGIRYAFEYGRRAGHVVADHLGDFGGAPERVLASELPSFRVKSALRFAFEHCAPNWLIDSVLMTKPMLALAQRIYFRRHGTSLSFDQYAESVARETERERLT